MSHRSIYICFINLSLSLSSEDDFSVSSDLSNIMEAKFDDGHRTSTPNISQRKHHHKHTNSNLLSPNPNNNTELKQIKKQLKDLQRMYQDIMRIIDTDGNSASSANINSIESSTSLSSYDNSSGELPKIKNNRHKNKQQIKGNSHHSTRADSQNELNDIK